MPKRYINARVSFNQENADNWLLMIPTNHLSSDSKIVYLALKKMQWKDGSCQTDANTWLKVTGLNYSRVKECFVELEAFGLIEIYLSPKEFKHHKNNVKVYLLDHFLMQKSYNIMDCPHDGISVQNPLNDEHILQNKTATRHIQEFKDEMKEAKKDGIKELD